MFPSQSEIGLHSFYPAIEPYQKGILEVGDGHSIYWEVCGNPQGKPALFLHGGPGSGCSSDQRRLFDPKKYHIVLFDQRGCGRSTPRDSLEANTTHHLISDIEKIRKFLKINKWVILGGSWGSALALAYGQKYPDHVEAMIVRGVFALRKKEITWFYQEGASFLFPEAWDRFLKPLTLPERENIVHSYKKRLASQDTDIRLEAARAWTTWEGETMRLLPDKNNMLGQSGDKFALTFAAIENHYFINNGFLEEGQLIRDAHKLAHIPGTIIQGRYDVVCPPVTAWDLHANWPSSKLIMVPDAGHAYNEPGILSATLNATDDYAL